MFVRVDVCLARRVAAGTLFGTNTSGSPFNKQSRTRVVWCAVDRMVSCARTLAAGCRPSVTTRLGERTMTVRAAVLGANRRSARNHRCGVHHCPACILRGFKELQLRTRTPARGADVRGRAVRCARSCRLGLLRNSRLRVEANSNGCPANRLLGQMAAARVSGGARLSGLRSSEGHLTKCGRPTPYL